MADGTLYARYWQVTVGRPLGDGPTDLEELISFGELRTVFQIERTHKPDPNPASVSLYNLSADTRGKLAGKGLSIVLDAGYKEHHSVILRADITKVSHRRDGADWVTKLEAGDGALALAQSRVSESYKAGAKISDAIQGVGKKMKISVTKALGQLKDGKLDPGRALDEFVHGVALVGQGKDMMDQLTKATGLEWSVQNNELVITSPGQPSADQAVVLAPGTGLLGSPEPGEEGKLSLKCLIVPGLDPPRKVKVESRTYEGFARVDSAKYSGDSHGSDWFCDLEVAPIPTPPRIRGPL